MKFTKAFTAVAYDFTISRFYYILPIRREKVKSVCFHWRIVSLKNRMSLRKMMARNFADFLKRATPTVYYRLSRTLIDFLNLY